MSAASFFRNLTAPFRGLFFNLIDRDPYSKPVNKTTTNTPGTTGEARQLNARGIELIKHFEGCYLGAYQDSVGVWTIGYGHTGLVHRDGTVKAGRTITQAEAEELLRHDLRVFARRVTAGTQVPLSDDQFAALVSFDFNTGGFLKSTLRKKLNAGDYAAAAEQLLLWDKAGGKRLRGLTRRRRSERKLFLGEHDFIERDA